MQILTADGDTFDPELDLDPVEIDLDFKRPSRVPFALNSRRLHKDAERAAIRRRRHELARIGRLFEGAVQ